MPTQPRPHQTPSSRVIRGMNKLRFFPVTGMLFATILIVAACGSSAASQPAAAPSTRQAAPTEAASTSATSAAGTVATASVSTPSVTASVSSGPTVSPAFAKALAAWKNAAAANAATQGFYLQQAVNDLQAAGNPGYGTAINELTYLEHLPPTNDTPAQQANAKSDVKSLDSFFGTPGLMS